MFQTAEEDFNKKGRRKGLRKEEREFSYSVTHPKMTKRLVLLVVGGEFLEIWRSRAKKTQ